MAVERSRRSIPAPSVGPPIRNINVSVHLRPSRIPSPPTPTQSIGLISTAPTAQSEGPRNPAPANRLQGFPVLVRAFFIRSKNLFQQLKRILPRFVYRESHRICSGLERCVCDVFFVAHIVVWHLTSAVVTHTPPPFGDRRSVFCRQSNDSR